MVLAAGGTAAAWTAAGPRAAGGFAVGALLSAANYRWLKRSVEFIGTGDRPRRGSAAVLALRYLIIGATAYVIVTYLELNVLAVLLGLLVSVAAVILEILYELLYAGT